MADFGFDDWMDAELRNVPVPRDLAARLSAARGAQGPGDEQLDEALRNVTVPPDLGRRLRRIAREDSWSIFLGKLALAACVLVMIAGGGYYLLLAPGGTPPPQAALETARPLAQAARRASAAPKIAARSAPPGRDQRSGVARQKPVQVRLGESLQATENELPKALANVTSVGSSLREAMAAGLRTQSALGAGGRIEELPPLEVFEPTAPRGIAPPRVRGYDMLFQLRYGEHPFVSPAASRELQTSRVPFSFRTTSWDAAATALAQGRVPAAESIRVEDFLAAQRYALPEPPTGGVAFHAAASPTPLGGAGQHLLQLAVQGGKLPATRRQPVRLVAMIDTSSAMHAGQKTQIVERALGGLVRHLGPEDRVTVLGFARQPEVLAEAATRTDLERLVASGTLADKVAAAGAADLAAAIEGSRQAVLALAADRPRRLVLIASGRDDLRGGGVPQASEALAHLAAAGVSWQIVRLSGGEQAELAAAASAAGGKLAQALSADELTARMLESLVGRSTTVASGVSMRITFNPKVVTSYRLLGHEAATLTGEAADPLEVDLAAEQAATCLYELWLKPVPADPKQEAGRAGDLAIVEILWRDPASGQPRRSVQPIRRAQVAGSFSQAPAWHQQAVLAARAAEFLRASYYVPKSRRLGQLLALTAEVDPRVAAQRDFRALVSLIEKADKR